MRRCRFGMVIWCVVLFFYEPLAEAQEVAIDAVVVGEGALEPHRDGLRRRARTIQNREFSNKDKILLLLSAHCDVPTKADLIATMNLDMIQEEASEVLKRASELESGATLEAGDFVGRYLLKNPSAAQNVETYVQLLLFDVLQDRAQLSSVRRRALESLSFFQTPSNEKMFEYIVSHPETVEDRMILVQAIRSYPKISPVKAPSVLSEYLNHPDDLIRFVTISTLQNTPSIEAVEVLKRRVLVERNSFFKKRLEDAIEKNVCH